MEHLYDCAWGDPYFLLEILNKMYVPSFGSSLAIQNCTYAPDLGDEVLLNRIREITKQCTGNDYKYFCITNGATQALNSCIRQIGSLRNVTDIVTSQMGYPYYPHMINKTQKFNHKRVDFSSYSGDMKNELYIVDSPSNPLGEQFPYDSKNTIWDGVYHNKIYNALPSIKPRHDVFVGSFSKLLGLTGARVGWLATNNEDYFRVLSKDTLFENATISRPSQKLINSVLNQVNLEDFMAFGKNSLDQNRHILHKLHNLTRQEVQEVGMFYCFDADQKLIDLFSQARVKSVVFHNEDGSSMIRLNTGQTADVLEKAVKAIQKADGGVK